jgi:hypothetical protein
MAGVAFRVGFEEVREVRRKCRWRREMAIVLFGC